MTKRTMLTVAVIASSLTMAACGGTSSPSNTAGGKPTTDSAQVAKPGDKKIYSMIPERYNQKIVDGVQENAGMPYGTVDKDGNIVGLAADMAKALEAVLGVNVKVKGTDFSALIPGMKASRYNISTSVFNMLPERAKQVDFVEYLDTGFQFIVPKSGGKRGITLDNVCGLTVATNTGSSEQDMIIDAGKKCKSAGKAPVKVLGFAGNNQAILSVKSGRADTFYCNSSQALYISKNTQGLAISSPKVNMPTPHGLAVAKGTGLFEPMKAAMLKLYDSGKLKAILAKYNIETALVPRNKIADSAPVGS